MSTQSLTDDRFLEMNEQQVREIVEGEGGRLRVMRRDWQNMFGDCQYDPSRLNVAVENEVVKEILKRG